MEGEGKGEGEGKVEGKEEGEREERKGKGKIFWFFLNFSCVRPWAVLSDRILAGRGALTVDFSRLSVADTRRR